MKRKPYDYEEYLRNSKEDKYPLGLHEDIPMSSSYCMLISRQRREISGREKEDSVTCPHYLGSHCYSTRDGLLYASASRHLGRDYSEGDSVHGHGSSENSTLVDPMREISECTLDLQRELREGAEYGLRPVGSSMNILIDQVRGPLFSTRVPSAGLTVEQPLTCLQSSTDDIIQKPSLHEFMDRLPKMKHIDNYSLRDYSCETTLNGSSYYAKPVEMETNDSRLGGRRLTDPTHNNDSDIEPLAYLRGRPLSSDGLERIAAPGLLLKEGKHEYTYQRSLEPWVSQRWERSLGGTFSDCYTSFRESYRSGNQWRDRGRAEEAYNKHSEPESPRSCKMRHHKSDSSEKVDIPSYGGFESMHKRPYGTYLSPFRAEECTMSLDVIRSDYSTRLQENGTIDDHLRQERRAGNAYNKYSDIETSRRYKMMRTFADDNSHSDAPSRSQTHGGSHYMHGYPSETSLTGVDRCTRTGTGKDYHTRIPEMEMNIDQGKEQRRFVSTYEKYPEAEPPSYRSMRSFHDYCSGRVLTSGLPIDNGLDHVLGQRSERWVSCIKSSSPSKGKRRNHLRYDDDSVGEIEKEQSCYYENECNDQHMPWDEHSAKYGAPLRCGKPIRRPDLNENRRTDLNENRQPDLNENSEEFKQRVNGAYLRFSKSLNENSEQKKKYQKQGKSGSLSCIVCGRHSKDFVDTHCLAMHAYYSQEADRLAEHKALYKALCVLMGWNQDMPPDNARSYQSLGLIEARDKQEDLILWPPLIIVHNTCIGKGKDGLWEGIGNQEMDKLLTELGFGSGKAKALYGREGHKGILVVKFLPTVAGLQEAERLQKYFECHKRGRKDWVHIQSSHTGKQHDDEGPDLIRIDEKTKEKKRVLYGYMGIAGDLGELDFDTRKRISVKGKKDMEKIDGPTEHQ